MRLTNGASDGTYKYMVDGIRYICENFKERAPGTHSERKAQKFLKTQLENWADEVEMEDFHLHPKAFMGWIPLAGIICILSVFFYWLTYKGAVQNSALAVVSVIMTLFAVSCLVVEFLMYREYVDFFSHKEYLAMLWQGENQPARLKEGLFFVDIQMLLTSGHIHCTVVLNP